jgi:2-succinyl-5-enolpyruvyl-6-hydroxy-3-cyclohexene-1-carboxylate synthase
MALDFRNINTLWVAIATETLSRLGLQYAIVCPGSRSTPLTLALANHPAIDTIPILDERSAAFFALGLAKRTHLPVALVCTSGTAGANFYPAIIEAKESRVPLIVFTADRPAELRDCASGQTIDQQKLFGSFPNYYGELVIPSASRLAYIRQAMIHAWRYALEPTPGPVHLNCPFRDPLAPIVDSSVQSLAESFDENIFFAHLPPPVKPISGNPSGNISGNISGDISSNISGNIPLMGTFWELWRTSARGVIIAGIAQPANPQAYCQAVAQLSQVLGWPVLAEGLSPLRNYQALNPDLIFTYDSILRNPIWAERLKPEFVIQLGPLPTSKVLREWLTTLQPQRWVVDPSGNNLDPLHGPTVHISCTAETLSSALAPLTGKKTSPKSDYWQDWLTLNQQLSQWLNKTLAELSTHFEGKIAWLLGQTLPPQTPILIANSMPIRDIEYFWPPNNRQIQPFCNRGANGIDGTLSTAMGIAHQGRSTVLLTGDLAFLHDTNGLLNAQHLQGHLTVILVNNNGGGIFEMLPIAQFDPPFEKFFATPQQVNMAVLCQAYGIEHCLIETWQQLTSLLSPLPKTGIRVLEIRTNRKQDAAYRKQLFTQMAQANSTGDS